LTRKGQKKRPFYRVVVAEKSSPRDGRFVEIVGHYNPIPDPFEFRLDMERIQYWISQGAKPSETVKRLIDKATASAEAP